MWAMCAATSDDSRAPTAPPNDLPSLAEFLRWMGEMPAIFRTASTSSEGGGLALAAVVADLWETLTGERPAAEILAVFRPGSVPKSGAKSEINRLQWVQAACHLLWHPALRARGAAPENLRKLFIQDLAVLASVVSCDQLLADLERREELIRLSLRSLELRLPGESQTESEDRLSQVDSVERRRLLTRAAEKEKRAREVRDMMARKAAEEAAAKVSRE